MLGLADDEIVALQVDLAVMWRGVRDESERTEARRHRSPMDAMARLKERMASGEIGVIPEGV